MEPLDLDWSDAFDVADWIRDRLHPFGSDIGSVIPDGFDAYVVLVHPERAHEPPAEMLDSLARLLAAHTTTPDHIWYCIWEGYGSLHGGAAVSGQPPGLVPQAVRSRGRVVFPYRNYYLYAGDRGGWSSLRPWELPNIWWPNDRAWCVAREIDFVATYVGGPKALITALLADPVFPAIAVSPEEPWEEGREFHTRAV